MLATSCRAGSRAAAAGYLGALLGGAAAGYLSAMLGLGCCWLLGALLGLVAAATYLDALVPWLLAARCAAEPCAPAVGYLGALLLPAVLGCPGLAPLPAATWVPCYFWHARTSTSIIVSWQMLSGISPAEQAKSSWSGPCHYPHASFSPWPV